MFFKENGKWPPIIKQLVDFEVGFDIDANGILNVSAKDKATGKEQSIRIEASSGLSKDEIEKMVNDAKMHAAEDKKHKDEVDLKNSADQIVYQTEKNIKEYGDKLDSELKGKLEAAVGRVKEAQKSSNVDELRSATDALNQIWQEAASKMYAQTANSQDGAQAASEQKQDANEEKDGNIQDADYEVVDDDK
jgi:molecular chaperone DnaK